MTAAYGSIGHGRTPSGGYDPGTQGDGGVEHELARQVVAAAAAELARLRIAHVAERCPDGANAHAPNWSGSAIRVNVAGVEVAVEVHFDWIRAPRGGFGIHDGSRAARDLADAIGAHWRDAGLPRRAHQTRPGLGFLRNTDAVAILWECDRVGSYTGAELAVMGRAIARGIADSTDTRLPPIPGGIMTPSTDRLPRAWRIGRTPAVFTVERFRIHRYSRAEADRELPAGWDSGTAIVKRMQPPRLFRWGRQATVWAALRLEGRDDGWIAYVPNPDTAAALAGHGWRDQVATIDAFPI